ncbi:MAG: GNAT family N-acetyltransferase [Thiolinea sp.]
MASIQVESFKACREELGPIFEQHYKELALHTDKVPLDPDWKSYYLKEFIDELLFITARDEGVLVGYYSGIISTELHYKSTVSLKMDLIYIHPDLRKTGLGNQLMDFVEREAMARGCQRIFNGGKDHKDIGGFWAKRGYTPADNYVCKWVGE